MPLGPMLAMGGISVLSDILRGPGERRRAKDLAKKYEEAQRETERRQEDRYRQLMRGYRGMYTRGMKGFEGAEERAAERIERGAGEERARVEQDVTGRGLAGTTVLPGLRAGVEERRTSALTGLAGEAGGMRARYEQGLTQPRLGMMERRTDEYPDFGEMASLSRMQGAGGPFGGGAFGQYMQNLPQLYMMGQGMGRRRRATRRPDDAWDPQPRIGGGSVGGAAYNPLTNPFTPTPTAAGY